MIINIILLIIGFILLVKGADLFVDGAACVAKKLGVKELIVGLTIVAMGTSLPEAAVSITSALDGNAGISVGNVVGSNILNVLIILGITSCITGLAIHRSTIRYEIPFVIAITAIFALFGYTGGAITRPEGVALWVLFIIYIIYLLVMSKKDAQNEDDEETPSKNLSVPRCLIYIAAGAAMIKFGADFAVDGASGIARYIGISERFIGLTIVALGTSLPELVTSIIAAKKGSVDIAVGNIVGSNIFNILFVAGTTALIIDVPFEARFLIDAAVAFAALVILWIGTVKTKELKRPVGVIMLLAYAGYFIYLCMI